MSQGRKSKNDYRNYLWIKFEVSERIYWITLFYNDVDQNSGNQHTQIGKIQFWKNINGWEKGIGTPNMKENRHWCFCPKNAYDPKQKVDGDGYFPARDITANTYQEV